MSKSLLTQVENGSEKSNSRKSVFIPQQPRNSIPTGLKTPTQLTVTQIRERFLFPLKTLSDEFYRLQDQHTPDRDYIAWREKVYDLEDSFHDDKDIMLDSCCKKQVEYIERKFNRVSVITMQISLTELQNLISAKKKERAVR